jgi:predicted nucleic acid-binding protein
MAIVLDEAKKNEAYAYWKEAKMRCSSILLKIETVIALRRSFEQNKDRLGNHWLTETSKTLQDFLNEVHYYVVNKKIEQQINTQKELSGCRSLDAIHVATALTFRELPDVSDVHVYTFDNRMKTLAEHFKFNSQITKQGASYERNH